jgi:DNA-binding transcriptional regulator GbsR (MarR family)
MPDASLSSSRITREPLRSGERTAEVVAFEAAMVEFFVEAAEVFGLPKSVASIYGVVFASPAPLSFAEIEEKLDFSKGSVSQGLKVLREMGALKEVSQPGDRAERFVPDLELKALVSGFLRSKVLPQLAQGGARLPELKRRANAIKGMSPAERKALEMRLDKLRSWQRKGQAVIPIISKFFG